MNSARSPLCHPASRCSSPRAPWIARAMASGVAATALASGLGALTYRALPGTATLAWSRLGPAILAFAIVTGICVGVGVGAATLRATRIGRTTLLGLASSAAVGGAVAGIVPGYFGSAGFGSLHAPYLGSLNVLSCVLAGATAFVALWAPRLLPQSIAAVVRPAHRIGLATLAAVITAGSTGLLGGVMALSFALVPSLGTLRGAADTLGLPALGMVAGASAGMLGGALIGLCCWIFLGMCRRTADA